MDDSLAPGAAEQDGAGLSGQADHAAAPSQAQLERSQSAIRDTTKWLVAAAAAVGAVVVAGLQLSHLPYGGPATTLAIAGFLIAIGGVAVVLLSASAVLSAGYTTLGQLADLYDPEVQRKESELEWQERDAELEQSMAQAPRLRRWWLRVHLGYRKVLRPMRIHFAKENGIRVAAMISFLERDAVLFTSFLAATIPELYGLIRATDKEVLELRGEVPALRERTAGISSPMPEHVEQPSGSKSKPAPAAKPTSLAEVEWRALQLKIGAGQLVAFANQHVVEQRFRVLKSSVQYGGAAVLAGVALFALAPKLAQERPLSVTAPTKIHITVKQPGKFGRSCTMRELTGVAIGGSWDEPIVITDAAAGCPVTRLVLKSSIGLAIPAGG